MVPNLIRLTIAILLSVSILASPASADEIADRHTNCYDDAMLVFDASGSMAGKGYNGLSPPRILEARYALRRLLPQITPYRQVGLIVYGPGPKDACSNIELRLRPTINSASRIIAEVDKLVPDGKTPLTQAVFIAAETLRYRERPGVVVLVTDGHETCGGATCALAAKLAEQGSKLTVHVIGFKVRSVFFEFPELESEEAANEATGARCLSELTGGKYVHAETTEGLVKALRETMGCPMLSDAGLNGEALSLLR